ncbi:MAG: hypothetical protein KGL45_09530 [Gammaproteobacteria bacterium]|nr:hypothetical protein [Gammaproteobacteria bacterium]
MSNDGTDDEIVDALAAIAWWHSRSPGERLFWVVITGSSDPRLTWAAFKRNRAAAPAEPPRALLEYHGSVYLLKPINDAARDWLRETAPEEAQFWGDALAIEPPYVTGIVQAFEDAGGEAIW